MIEFCWIRPGCCRARHFPKLDQQQMLDVRSAWFDGNYGPPPGNKREHGSIPQHRCAERCRLCFVGGRFEC